MAEKETKNEPKDLIEATPEELLELEKEVVEEIETLGKKDKEEDTPIISSWVPKTKLGKAVKAGKEKNIDKILSDGKKILEAEIVDALLPIEADLILIGQAKGKFGVGRRRAWRQTQKKTMEGNVMPFS